MLDRLGVPVLGYARAKTFYIKIFEPLGYGLVNEAVAEKPDEGTACGFGLEGRPRFWIFEGKTIGAQPHIAFPSPSLG